MYDIIIIGAGVVGSCIARELSKYELKTLVLEKEIEAACGTSKANSGIIHGGYDAKTGTLKAKLNVRGNYLVRQLHDRLGIHFKQIGSLVIAFSEEEMQTVKLLYERGVANGVEMLEIWERKKLLSEEPNVSKDAVGALYCGSAGVVCPFDMNLAFLENAIDNGVEFLSENEVLSITKDSGWYNIKTNTNVFKTKLVINAAGLYSADIAKMVGDNEFKILPRRGEYRVFDKNYSSVVNHVCFQAPTNMGKGVLVLPSYYGNFLIGPSAENIPDCEDTSTSSSGISFIDEKALKTVPSLNLRDTIRVFAGVRACPDTGDFMIYPSKNSQGVIHVGGIESPGLSSAPAIGEYVVVLAKTEGKKLGLNFVEKKNFNEVRKPIPQFSSIPISEQEKLIKQDEQFAHIVCRCESVTEAEIVQAINRPAGARTLDGVKRRVRPGAGRCQGGFCATLVLKILSRELNLPLDKIRKDRLDSNIIYGKLKGRVNAK